MIVCEAFEFDSSTRATIVRLLRIWASVYTQPHIRFDISTLGDCHGTATSNDSRVRFMPKLTFRSPRVVKRETLRFQCVPTAVGNMCCAVGKNSTSTLKKQLFDSVQGRRITFSYISSLEWSATPANVPLTVIITYLKYRLHLERFHRVVNLRFKYGIQEYLSSSSSQKIEVDAVSITNDSRSPVLNSPPHIQRQNSLRTKLSLPNLRRKQSRNNVNEDPVSSSPSMTGSLISHAPQDAAEMLQVKDTEFKLVAEFCAFPGRYCADE